MNDSTRVMHRPRRAGPSTARTAAAIIATAVLALLAAACSGSGGSPNAGGSANSPSAVGYSRCIRSHGVPNYPDPGGSGQIPKETAQQLGVSISRLEAAQGDCLNLLPNGSQPSQAQQQRQTLNDELTFARCMRSHGVPNWPDPTTGPHGPGFVINVSRDGFDPNSPQIRAKAHECQHVLSASAGLPLVTVSP